MTKLYLRLVKDGIKKNSRLYIPYILAGSVMVMMFYILLYLSNSKTLSTMPAASFLATVLPLGVVVIAIFSLIFLKYTNSFLIKQRLKEFGLYNVLGMNKNNLNRLLFIETLVIFFLVMISGLSLGIIFSKLGELIIINLSKTDIDYSLSISLSSIIISLVVYFIIYLFILLGSLINVRKSNPIELMKSSSVGEKEPKGNLLLAIIGLIILSIAYYLATSFSDSFISVFIFFIAVILVVIGTYILFIVGSVTLCRLLKKNKNYYYKSNHFISLSSLSYRMKRNGAGLASICILLTMVMVMISSTSSLYFGLDDSIKKRYPKEVSYTIYFDNFNTLKNSDILSYAKDLYVGDVIDVKYMELSGSFSSGGMLLDSSESTNINDYSNLGYLYVVDIDEYNRITNQNEKLNDDECFLAIKNTNIKYSTFKTSYSDTYKVVKNIDKFIECSGFMDYEMPMAIMVINDGNKLFNALNIENKNGITSYVYCKGAVDFDNKLDLQETIDTIYSRFEKTIDTYHINVDSRTSQRELNLGLFASMLFLGIMLSIVFVLAMVLIIYYKQISEGTEDQKRYQIMQKVGLTKAQIRNSINSQMLTVFFSPLLLAGMHMAFAFPFIWSMLNLFGFVNIKLMIIITLLSFIFVSIFYIITYIVTSKTYYKIVTA